MKHLLLLTFSLLSVALFAGIDKHYTFEESNEGFSSKVQNGSAVIVSDTTSAEKYAGNKCYHSNITTEGSGNIFFAQSEMLEASSEEVITASVWVRATEATDLILRVTCSTSTGSYIKSIHAITLNVDNQQWVKLEGTVTLEPNTGKVQFAIYHQYSGDKVAPLGLEVFIDEFKIRSLSGCGSADGNETGKYYVSPLGNDDDNGLTDAPLKSIAKALYYAQESDSIILRDGLYQESNVVVSDKISIVAEAGAKPVISGLDTITNWVLQTAMAPKPKFEQLFTFEAGKEDVTSRIGGTTNAEIVTENSDQQHYNGSKSLHTAIQPGGTGNISFFETPSIDMTSGDVFDVSAWVYASEDCELILRATLKTATNSFVKVLQEQSISVVANTWTPISKQFTIIDNGEKICAKGAFAIYQQYTESHPIADGFNIYADDLHVLCDNETTSEEQNYNIYVADVSEKVSQLFVSDNGELSQMVYARYPNLTSNDLFDQTYAVADVVDYNAHAASSLTDTDMELEGIDVSDATLWLPYPFSTKWNSFTEKITSQTSTSLSFTASESEVNLDEGKNTNVDYFLYGSLSLLDAEGEWFYAAGKLYFKALNNVDPSELIVLARTRDWGFVVPQMDHTTLSGIEFLATGVDVTGNYNTIDDCNFYYPAPMPESVKRWKDSPYVICNGVYNKVKNCEFAYSWTSGVSMTSSEVGTLENCLVHDCNWIGSAAPGAWLDGDRMTAAYNTVYNVGRDGIRIYRTTESLYEYNHIYNFGRINHDLGGIKGGDTDYAGTIFRYNLIHDNEYSNSKSGVYLDYHGENAIVHHNVHYGVHFSANTQIMDNPTHNIEVYNNTILKNNDGKTWNKYGVSTYENVKAYNNLSTNVMKGTDNQNNFVGEIADMDFVGQDYLDFRLKSTSLALDYGISIFGITAGVIDAPDAGAYEYGDTSINGTWMAGITWTPTWNHLPTADFDIVNIEGDSIFSFTVKDEEDTDGWIMRYDWSFGDGNTSYGKEVNHTYISGGEMDVTLTIHDNTGGKIEVSKKITSSANRGEPSGLNNQESISTIKLLSNPVVETLFISSPQTIYSCQILSTTGVIVLKADINDNRDIDVSSLNEGMYLLKCTLDNGNAEILKFIKR